MPAARQDIGPSAMASSLVSLRERYHPLGLTTTTSDLNKPKFLRGDLESGFTTKRGRVGPPCPMAVPSARCEASCPASALHKAFVSGCKMQQKFATYVPFALMRCTPACAPLRSMNGLRRGPDIVFLVLFTEGVFLYRCSAPFQPGLPLQYSNCPTVVAL